MQSPIINLNEIAYAIEEIAEEIEISQECSQESQDNKEDQVTQDDHQPWDSTPQAKGTLLR